ncbi:MAG TPA: MFS transporter, partial [Terriglobia bacterium]|nr:MFS transporter [Terriglobia bacterium]
MAKEESLKSFWSLIATQFQGAFSDMTYKTLLMMVAIATATNETQGSERVSTVNILFILPFLVFSMYGGFLADRCSKRSVTLWTKLAEVFIMILATVAAWKGSLTLGMGVLFLLGTQAAFFGPTKYGILPELLPEKRLSWGNGILEMTTFLSIILGTMAGGVLVERLGGKLYLAGLMLAGLALLGVWTSLSIRSLPPANPAARFRWNSLTEIFRTMALARQDRVLWLAVVGSIYFWFLGLLIQTNVLLFGKNILNLTETRISYLLASLAIGIGTGSYVAGNVSGKRIEYGLIPLGSIGISTFLLVLALPGWSFWSSAAFLAALGFAAGFFIVPLNALLQHRPVTAVKGSIIAMANLMTFVGMLVATAVYWILTVPLQLSPLHVYAVAAVLTVVATIYVSFLLPDSLMRLVLWLLTHSVYRIRVVGEENIP